VSGDSGAVQEVLEVLLALANLPTASSLQFPSHTVDVGPVPFLNRSLLEDYHDAYDFTKTLTTALKKKEREDARISLFEAHLCSIQAIGGKEPRPGALKVLLYSSGAPLPQIDRKGKGRVGPTSVDAPPPAGRSDDLDMMVMQVLDVLPDTPLDYVRALLRHPDYPNPERVVGALLEGTAPPISDLIRTAVELPPPHQDTAQEQFVYTQGRRNVFDNQEMDLAHVRVGKKR
jgi:activating signal cointegrator complex subunit 2